MSFYRWKIRHRIMIRFWFFVALLVAVLSAVLAETLWMYQQYQDSQAQIESVQEEKEQLLAFLNGKAVMRDERLMTGKIIWEDVK